MSTDEVLTIPDAVALGEIIAAADGTKRVSYLSDYGDMIRGTARHIVKSPDNCGFVGAGEDVRDGYLRITTAMGFEQFISVRTLVEKSKRGEFLIN